MTKLLGAAAAALLLSAGTAGAGTLTFTFTDAYGVTSDCNIQVTQKSDASHGVAGNILLSGYADDCGGSLAAMGVIGRVSIAREFGGKDVAVLVGRPAPSTGYDLIELVLQLTDGAFREHGKYLLYGIGVGSDTVYGGQGRYHYTP